MFQVFVDSAANLPAVTAKKYDIHVVSFVNLVNGKELVCFDPDLSPEEELAKGKEYYNAMRTGCEIKTGLISTANFADAFRTALEADQDVIYLSLSKNISGTYNSARLAAEELLEEYGGKRKIRLIDSLNASLAQGILAIYASEMRDRGMNVDEAADLLETYVSKMNGVFTVGDLKYLSRTGRIKGSVAVVGNMLKIKPILRGSEDGYIVSYKNVTGRDSRSVSRPCGASASCALTGSTGSKVSSRFSPSYILEKNRLLLVTSHVSSVPIISCVPSSYSRCTSTSSFHSSP